MSQASSIDENPGSVAEKHPPIILAQYPPSNENNNLSTDLSLINEVCTIIGFY